MQNFRGTITIPTTQQEHEVTLKLLEHQAPTKDVLIQKNLRHPNVVECFGVFWLQDTFGFVLEYTPGGTLNEHLHGAEAPHYSEFDALRWAANVASGMAYLHARKVVHGDLRSTNVLLVPTRDNKWLCKVSGFALLKNVSAESVGVNVRWTAPELLQTAAVELEPTEQSDAYSFGMVLWELIAREIPYSDLDEDNVCVLVPQGTRPKMPPSCNESISNLLRSLWDEDVDERPALAVTLIKLQEVLASKTKPFATLSSNADVHYSLAWRRAAKSQVMVAPQRPLPSNTDAMEIANTFSASEIRVTLVDEIMEVSGEHIALHVEQQGTALAGVPMMVKVLTGFNGQELYTFPDTVRWRVSYVIFVLPWLPYN